MHLPVLPNEEVGHIDAHMQIALHLITHFDPGVAVAIRYGQSQRKRCTGQRRIIIIIAFQRNASHFVVMEANTDIKHFAPFMRYQSLTQSLQFLARLSRLSGIVELFDFGEINTVVVLFQNAIFLVDSRSQNYTINNLENI